MGEAPPSRGLAELADELEQARLEVVSESASTRDALALAKTAVEDAMAAAAVSLATLAVAAAAADPARPSPPADQAEGVASALDLLRSEAGDFREATERAFAEASAASDLAAILSGLAEVDQTLLETCAVGLATWAAESVLALSEQLGGRVDAALAPVFEECDRMLAAPAPEPGEERGRAGRFEAVRFPPPVWAGNLLFSLRQLRSRIGSVGELRRELDARLAISRTYDRRLVESSSPLLRLGALKDLLRRIKDVTDFINPYD